MKLPKVLWIGENEWKVKMVRKIGRDNRSGTEVIGLCDPSIHTIFIKTGQDLESKLTTFFHELTHCFEYEYKFELKHPHVYKLGEALAKVFLENL